MGVWDVRGVVCAISLVVGGNAAAQYGTTARVKRDAWSEARAGDVVEAQEAERAAAGNVGDTLEESEGVVVQRTSSVSASPIVRGLTGNRVLLVVDQLRLNDALTRAGGHALLNLIDAESVERVEVVRGPASVMHGSDALGGVVRVVTRRAGASHRGRDRAWATAYLRGASAERALRGQLGAGVTLGRFGARVSGGRGHSGLLQRGGGLGEQPYTGHDDFTLASQLELTPTARHRVGIAHQSGHVFDAPRSDVSSPDDVRTTEALDRDSVVFDYLGRFPEQHLRLLGYAGMSLRREWRSRVRPDQVRDEREHVLAYQLGLGLRLVPWGTSSLALGLEAVLEDVASNQVSHDATDPRDGPGVLSRGRYVDGSDYDTYAAYALLTQPLGERLTLLAGARLTLVHARAPIDPLFESEPELATPLDRRVLGAVGSLGARYEIAPGLRVLGGLLSGFRAPNLEDFQAFGGGARGFTFPNPELDEERSFTLEGGLVLDREDLQLSLYAWGTRLVDLIVRVPSAFRGMREIDGEPVLRRDNASHGHLLGGETSLTYRFESGLGAGLSAWASWGETVRPDDGGAEVTEPASKVPPPMGALHVGYAPRGEVYWSRAILSGQAPQTRLSESDRSDVRICEQGPDDCDRAGGHVDLTLRAGVSLSQRLSLTIALENLFDAGYKTFASGAYAPGRNLIVSLRGRAE